MPSKESLASLFNIFVKLWVIWLTLIWIKSCQPRPSSNLRAVNCLRIKPKYHSKSCVPNTLPTLLRDQSLPTKTLQVFNLLCTLDASLSTKLTATWFTVKIRSLCLENLIFCRFNTSKILFSCSHLNSKNVSN